jgi:hypothetical protein
MLRFPTEGDAVCGTVVLETLILEEQWHFFRQLAVIVTSTKDRVFIRNER